MLAPCFCPSWKQRYSQKEYVHSKRRETLKFIHSMTDLISKTFLFRVGYYSDHLCNIRAHVKAANIVDCVSKWPKKISS